MTKSRFDHSEVDGLIDGRDSYGFSVNDFVFAKSVGLIPIRQVCGVSVCQSGQYALPSSVRGREIVNLTHFRELAWDNAIKRIKDSARSLDADMVIDIQVNMKQAVDVAFSSHETFDPEASLRVALIGTAVRSMDGSRQKKDPTLCSFSGPSLYISLEQGSSPMGLVHGHCVYYKRSYGLSFKNCADATPWSGKSANKELTAYTNGLNIARYTAATKMNDQARQIGASGVVGVCLNLQMFEVPTFGTTGVLIAVDAVGDAVKQVAEDSYPVIQPVVQLKRESEINYLHAR